MHFSEASQFWSNHGQMPTWQSHNSPKKIVLMILVMEYFHPPKRIQKTDFIFII
jgi:hypothetical protein